MKIIALKKNDTPRFLNWEDLRRAMRTDPNFSFDNIPDDAYVFAREAYSCFMYIVSVEFDLSKVPKVVLDGLASNNSNGSYAARFALALDFDWAKINNAKVKNKAIYYIRSVI